MARQRYYKVNGCAPGAPTHKNDPERAVWYSAGCTYWTDNWRRLGQTRNIPVCPFCGCVGYIIEMSRWMAEAVKFEEEGHPRYVEFLKQSKEKYHTAGGALHQYAKWLCRVGGGTKDSHQDGATEGGMETQKCGRGMDPTSPAELPLTLPIVHQDFQFTAKDVPKKQQPRRWYFVEFSDGQRSHLYDSFSDAFGVASDPKQIVTVVEELEGRDKMTRPSSHRIVLPERRCTICKHSKYIASKHNVLCFHGDHFHEEKSRWGGEDLILLQDRPDLPRSYVNYLDGDAYDTVWGVRIIHDPDIEVCDEWEEDEDRTDESGDHSE